jgi:transposase
MEGHVYWLLNTSIVILSLDYVADFKPYLRRCHSNVPGVGSRTLDEEEKASIARLEAINLDAMRAWQIRQNLQDVFTMPSVASARKYLSRWHAWVSTCDLLPMKKAASTIMAKADEILRSISSNLSNGLLEAINGNVQAAKRKAKGYRTKHNLKLMVYLIAGGVLDALPT